LVSSILPLKVENACVEKRGNRIVGPIDLEISQKGFTIIMGPNGSGKTSLLRLLHGLENPRGGSLDWNGSTETAQLHQSFVFQTPIMLRRTAIENIIYPLILRNIPKDEALKIAKEWIGKINLEKSTDINARFLSGGEKQKLAIARALTTKPQLLFLDEPTANLDGSATREIEALLQETHKAGTRIIMTTHNIGQGKRLAEDVMFIYRGNILETSNAKQFFKKPQTKEAQAFIDGDILE
jgi:tungstate transport system ATP-binding protein